MSEIPYNANPELQAMKQDIADRKYSVKLKGMLITGGLIIGGLALAAALPLVAPAGALSGLMALAKPLTYVAMAGGSAIVSMATMKEVKKLEMDEQYLQSYMQGKNYWGEGYREEVLEHGYSGPQLPFNGPPPPLRGKPNGRGA